MILRKIFKFVATRGQILRLKCTKFNFGWGSVPDPARGAYSALPDLLVAFKYLLLRAGNGMWEGRVEGMREEGRKGDPQGLVHTPMSKIRKNTLQN